MTDKIAAVRSREPAGFHVALCAVVMIGLLLSGCGGVSVRTSSPSSDGRPSDAQAHYKVGKPYQIDGVWYYPEVDERYDESGIASWYGADFHNKLTANGEVFDQNALTAAHPTLPMPSIVRVTNLENGREIVVRVNDRGPFARGRIIDLSRRAAQLLGFQRQGTIRARVQYLPDQSRVAVAMIHQGKTQPAIPSGQTAGRPVEAAPVGSVAVAALPTVPGSVLAKPRPDAAAGQQAGSSRASALDLLRRGRAAPGAAGAVRPTQLFVQVAAFASPTNADNLSVVLADMGSIAVRETVVRGQTMYQVRIGPLGDVGAADRVLDRVVDRGFSGARIVVD